MTRGRGHSGAARQRASFCGCNSQLAVHREFASRNAGSEDLTVTAIPGHFGHAVWDWVSG
jgi:hypothetical protein